MNKRDKENKITKTVNKNNIIKISIRNIIAMFLVLFFILTGAVEARGEIVSNLIREKENKINEIMLKANEGITLTRTYTNGTESIDLKWSAVEESGATYNVYQTKEGETEKIITSTTATSITLNKNNAGIKDEAAPTVPGVSASQTADGAGNNLTLQASTDKGTTYRHKIETDGGDKLDADIIFVIDNSKSMSGWIGSVKNAVRTIGNKFIDQGARVGIVVCGGAKWAFTTDKTQFSTNLNSIYRIRGVNLGSGVNPAREVFKASSTARNKVIIAFTDMPDNTEANVDIWLSPLEGEGIKIYTIGVGGSYNLQFLRKYGPAELASSTSAMLSVFEKMYNEAILDMKIESNTVSTTVTTGIKGYQYAITTSATHTFTDEEIVSLAEVPTYVSGEQEMAQYIHIRAVDNAGNVSETKSVLLQVPARITLKSDYIYGSNEVPLSWIINDKRPGYVYRLFQKEEGQETFTQIASSNSIEIVKYQGTKTVSYTTPGTYSWTVPEGVTSVRVVAVGGGAGGLTIADYDGRSPNGLSATAENGGDSSFGNFVAEGGKGATGYAKTWGRIEATQGEIATPNGRKGDLRTGVNFDNPYKVPWEPNYYNPVKGAKGFALGFVLADGNYGAGGVSGHYFDSDGTAAQVGAGGNSGAYNIGYVNVTPGQKITIKVGAGGKGVVNENDGEYGRYTVSDGTGGFVYFEYEQILYEQVIYEQNTVDTSATDKVAPAILELYLNGIKGDNTRYEIDMVSEDYGTFYDHYVTGTNDTYNMKITSNVETTEVLTEIKGYSWKLDNNEFGEADTIIGFDNDNNQTTTFPTTISTDYLDKGYYLHARAVDNAGNWGATVHLKLETTTITLTSHYNEYTDSNGYGPNYVPLTWENSNKEDKFLYKLFQKNEDQSEWMQVSTNYGKPVHVLNVYPNAGNNLKKWMQNYGLGLITVDEVPITSFNSNPNAYLKENGEYIYDVIMFGSWDYNNGYDLSWAAKVATEEFINTGRGVLFGHDTMCMESGCYHPNFSSLASYVKSTVKAKNYRVSGNVVKVVKKGFLTKYPYDIETRNLTVPESHTVGVYAYGDIWIKFLYTGGQTDIGVNNYFLSSWNNCAMIVTGHSNGAATEDEQKIIANVLFYLGQVTEDTYANVYTAEDLEAPEISDIKITDNKKQNRLELDIEGIDYGTEYDHYVTAMKVLTAGNYYSNTVHTIVKTGIQKFQYTINNSKTEYSGTQYEVPAVNKETCEINIDKSYIGQYLHIRAVDNADNVGEVTTIYLDGARTISREEKNETEELYCIEEDVLIPAEYDGTQSDATVEVAGNREALRWPLNIQKLFELYKEDGVALRNPYTTSGQSGFVDKSNSLGRYLVSQVPGTRPGKEGNAREAYAYILSHYADNNIEDSESQKALYEIIAEENGTTTDGSNRNLLYYEAKEYEKFRELLEENGGFTVGEETHNVQVGYNLENKQYIIGPFEVEYIRSYSIINDGKGNSKKVEFSGIGVPNGISISSEKAIRIYDQNGKLIDPDSWEIEYDNKAEKEETRGESYSEYQWPLPGEEFYIKLNRTGNEEVTEITKIEIEYYEMEADAKYSILSGEYNTVTWNADQTSNVCEGGTLCPHGRENAHTIGHTYFISSEITAANIDSQELLEVEWAKREYKSHVQTLTITANKGTNTDNDGGGDTPGGDDGDDDGDRPGGEDDDNGGEIEDTIRLTMDFSGNIWNDQNENISNGLKEAGEEGIKGVEVFLYDYMTNTQIKYTMTDEEGNYKFEKIPVGIYNIEFTYDGQTYKTTKSFMRGSEEDYKTNGNGKAYTNVSIVDEREVDRQELNNRFYEIKEGEAIGTNGERTSLSYKEEGKKSNIITREEGSEKAYQEFQIGVDTKNKDIYFPATNTIIVNNIPYLIIDDNKNINVGLSTREKTDENVKIDVYQTTFSIKGVRQSYLHNGRNIRDINSNTVIKEYIQKVNPADYEWRLSDYEGNEKYEEIKEIYGSGEDCELETYVEYMIILRNSGANDTAYITELVDYYDKTLEYRDNYRDFDISSWIVIRNDDETESNYTGNGSKEQIKWSEESRYGDTNEYSEDFNKMYANLEDYGIKKGQYAEIHIIFRVLKDENGNIMLDSGEGKKNVTEINGYRTLDTKTGNIAGLIDLDSKPGDVNPTEEAELYEDDEDKAPNYKLELDYTNGNTGGNNGDGTEGEGGGNTGDGNEVETDENGNPIGYGNTIEGNVWEDIKTITIEEDGRKISNGIKEDKEPVIDNVKVELVEVISGYVNGEYKEVEVVLEDRTIRTGNELLLTEKARSDGAYRFSGLTGGEYKVRFTYGEKEQLVESLKYNGQDYQGLSSAQIYNRDQIENSYENTEIMIVLDNSNSMTGGKIARAKQAAVKLIEDLKGKLPGVKIGVVNFNENANIIGGLTEETEVLANGINSLSSGGETAIGRGIREAKEIFENGKTKLMILITDGQETVEIEEEVIRQIEDLREKGIGLVSILTNNSDNIFGTEENPRYGEVYNIINDDEIYTRIVEEIYQKILKESMVEEDRSLGKDIEGEKENPEPGTRRWQINEYSEMTYKKATVLDVEGIDKLSGAEREKRIEELANTTYMRAESEKVEFAASNVGKSKIHEINQALVERPRARLELTEEITGIKVTLSDGNVIIDTAKGLSKNVMGLDVPDATVSVYMDEEIMQGATVEVTYKLCVTNTGEVDRLSNYFEGESDDTITTTAKVIYAYINQNMVYREDESGKDITWEVILEDSKNEQGENIMDSELSEETIEGVENGTTMTLRTEGLKEIELYPIGSKELKQGDGTYKNEITAGLILSRLISPEDDETTNLTYDCSMEITVRGNEVGRRVIGSIPGNHRVDQEGTVISLEPDEATTRRIIITKPLGENRSLNSLYIALASCIIIAGGIIIIKKKEK